MSGTEEFRGVRSSPKAAPQCHVGTEEFTQAFFEESSKAWMANKVRSGAMIYYKCQGQTLGGHGCSRAAFYTQAYMADDQEFLCKQHRKSRSSKRQSSG